MFLYSNILKCFYIKKYVSRKTDCAQSVSVCPPCAQNTLGYSVAQPSKILKARIH